MDLTQQHADIAWRHFLAQYPDGTRLEAFARALYAPAQVLQSALKALYDERWLDTAVGAQLDGIGEIVGQSRVIDDVFFVTFFGFLGQPNVGGFGINGEATPGSGRLRHQEEPNIGGSTTLLDAEYRKLLYWKIALNNGHGTAPEIAAAVRSIFDATIVRVADLGNAKIAVYFNTTPEANPAFLTNPARWIPKLAGVGIEVLITTPSDHPFGFSNQGLYGFGEGVLAHSF
jgi:hypothetical protein